MLAGIEILFRLVLISLIVPYLVYSLLTIVWHIIICVGFNNTVVSDMFTGWELIYRDLFCMVSGIGIGTLWFLPVLFVCYAVLTIIAGTINAGHMQKYRYIYLIIAFILLVLISIPLGTFYVNPDSLLLKMVDK